MNRVLPLLFVVFLLMPAASSQITDDYSRNSIEMPEWDNQQEMVQEYVAPFVFVYIILYFALTKTFHFILRDQQQTILDDGPDASTEAAILSVAIALMLMVTPFWDFIQISIQLLGIAGVIAFMAAFFFVIYLMAK